MLPKPVQTSGRDPGKMAEQEQEQRELQGAMTYKWTNEDVEKLVRLRVANAALFSGKRFASAAGWEAVLQKMGLSRLVSPARAAKKWENLKKTYKELKKPPTGQGTETEEPTAASWKWYSLMDEAIGSRPSVRPPCLIASSWEERPSTSAASSSVSVPREDEEDEDEGERTPAKRPRLSVVQFLERAEKREEEREKREEEREKKEEEREERLLKLLERIVDKMN